MRKIWHGISAHDRKLIKWTAIVCYIILMASLVVLFYIAKHAPEVPPETEASAPSADSVHGDVQNHQSDPFEAEPLPPPPPGTEALLSGLDTFDAKAHLELARIFFEKQDYANSLIHSQRIELTMEHDAAFQSQMGHTLLAAGRPAEAISRLEKAIKLGAKDSQVLGDLALAKFRGQNPDSGLASMQSAQKAFPGDPALETHYAAMFGEVKDKGDGGEALLRKVVAKFPKFAEARYQYGRFLMNQGNYASSLRELEVGVKLDPLDSRMHARLGMALFHLGRDEQAEHAYKTALAMNPRDYNTWYNLGELHLSIANESDQPAVFAKRTRDALEAYLASLANHPKHPDAHYRVGVILNANRQNREAIRHLEYALQADPRSVPVMIQLATAWEALGSKSRAWDYIQQAFELDPFNQLVAAQYRRLRATPES